MTCIIFPGLLFFPSGLCRWKWLCTEGGVFSRKKIESDFLTQVLSQTPRASFEAGDSWLHYQTVMSPPPPGRIWGRPGHESTAPSWLEASGATALGDTLIAKYAMWPNPERLPSADCCDYERCPCVCLWESWFQTALEERSLPYWILLLLLGLRHTCFLFFFAWLSIISHQISRVVSATVQSSLVSFLLYKHQSKFECAWLNHMNNFDWHSDRFQVLICFIFMVIHNFHASIGSEFC